MKNLILFINLALFSTGCHQPAGQNENDPATTVESHDGHQHPADEDIALNNGEKWRVDAQMMTYIRAMENDANHYKQTGAKDYPALGKSLRANVELLTSNCTMEGKAHDELHKWLLPYIDLVNELSSAKDAAEAEKTIDKIQHSFQTFNNYFQ